MERLNVKVRIHENFRRKQRPGSFVSMPWTAGEMGAMRLVDGLSGLVAFLVTHRHRPAVSLASIVAFRSAVLVGQTARHTRAGARYVVFVWSG